MNEVLKSSEKYMLGDIEQIIKQNYDLTMHLLINYAFMQKELERQRLEIKRLRQEAWQLRQKLQKNNIKSTL
jgi:hypothetical protein